MIKNLTALGVAAAILGIALPASAVAAPPSAYEQLRAAVDVTNAAYSSGIYFKSTSGIDGPDGRETVTTYEGAIGTDLFGSDPQLTSFWHGQAPAKITDAWQVRTPGTATVYAPLRNLRATWSRNTASIVVTGITALGGNANSLVSTGTISQGLLSAGTRVGSPASVLSVYLDSNPTANVTRKTSRRAVTYTFVAGDGTTVTATTTPNGVITKLRQSGPYYNSELTTTVLGGGSSLKPPAALASAVDSPLPNLATSYETRSLTLRDSLQTSVDVLNLSAERDGVPVTKDSIRGMVTSFASTFSAALTIAETRRGFALTQPLPAEEAVFGPLCAVVVESEGRAKLGAC